jgi:hypothetical protein
METYESFQEKVVFHESFPIFPGKSQIFPIPHIFKLSQTTIQGHSKKDKKKKENMPNSWRRGGSWGVGCIM